MYMVTQAKQTIDVLLSPYFEGVELKIEVPPPTFEGDFAVPVFGLAKIQKKNPVAIAMALAHDLNLNNTLFQKVEAQGGFLNFILDPVRMTEHMVDDFNKMGSNYGCPNVDFSDHQEEMGTSIYPYPSGFRVGVKPRATGLYGTVHEDCELGEDNTPENLRGTGIVVDYSSPNVAKEMHVGHLRSTVIGDSLRRLYTFLGYKVIAQNHLGDWGTQFGLLIEYILDNSLDILQPQKISDLNELYQKAKQKDDVDQDFSIRARKRVVLLQGGDPKTLEIWHFLIKLSMIHFNEAYRRLGVLLQDSDVKAESSFNADLPVIVDRLKAMGLTTISDGAVCLFLEGFEREGKPIPMIIQKSDGGYLYHTTDLATLYYRLNVLKADRILYVVDVRQADHFKMLFAAAQKANWLEKGQKITHVAFGTILGKDNKPFKTREGGVIKLSDLLDEAVRRAKVIVDDKNPHFSMEEKEKLANIIGIGALKYVDLSGDRKNDYVFDWDRMLSFEGNTAPYLQYAVVRIKSLLEKAGTCGQAVTLAKAGVQSCMLSMLLTKKLGNFPEVILKAADRCEPHGIATYLYSLAQAFTSFYAEIPILKVDDPAVRMHRLWLCARVAQVLIQGLALLGIECPDRM